MRWGTMEYKKMSKQQRSNWLANWRATSSLSQTEQSQLKILKQDLKGIAIQALRSGVDQVEILKAVYGHLITFLRSNEIHGVHLDRDAIELVSEAVEEERATPCE
jgi:acid stress-induced BolA-like protein IbaG/YrbA